MIIENDKIRVIRYIEDKDYEKYEWKGKCDYCGKEYQANSKKFCSGSCGLRHHWENKNILKIDDTLHQVIDGGLLGDAGLELRYANPRYYFKQCERNIEYVEHIADFFNLKDSIRIVQSKKHTNNFVKKEFSDARFKTMQTKSLMPYFERWYPDGKKVIPKDFKITPISLLYAFLDDGSLKKHKDKKSENRTKYCGVYIYTNCFSAESINNILIPQFQSIGVNAHIYMKKSDFCKSKYYPIVVCSEKEGMKNFFNYIGKCPVKCFEYKWLPDEYMDE